jgi:hypothetical protein
MLLLNQTISFLEIRLLIVVLVFLYAKHDIFLIFRLNLMLLKFILTFIESIIKRLFQVKLNDSHIYIRISLTIKIRSCVALKPVFKFDFKNNLTYFYK